MSTILPVLSILPALVLGSSVEDRWSWPERHVRADNKQNIDRRASSNHELSRYQANNQRKSKPLSDEFSDEVGENFSSNNIHQQR